MVKTHYDIMVSKRWGEINYDVLKVTLSDIKEAINKIIQYRLSNLPKNSKPLFKIIKLDEVTLVVRCLKDKPIFYLRFDLSVEPINYDKVDRIQLDASKWSKTYIPTKIRDYFIQLRTTEETRRILHWFSEHPDQIDHLTQVNVVALGDVDIRKINNWLDQHPNHTIAIEPRLAYIRIAAFQPEVNAFIREFR